MKCIIFFCSTKISKYSYEYGINPEHNNSWGYNETVKLIEIVFFNRQTIKKLMDCAKLCSINAYCVEVGRMKLIWNKKK